MKKCAKCKEIKDDSCFRPRLTRSDGLYSYCYDCERIENRKKYEKRKAQQAPVIIAKKKSVHDSCWACVSLLECSIPFREVCGRFKRERLADYNDLKRGHHAPLQSQPEMQATPGNVLVLDGERRTGVLYDKPGEAEAVNAML